MPAPASALDRIYGEAQNPLNTLEFDDDLTRPRHMAPYCSTP